jgi:hypothetical protein
MKTSPTRTRPLISLTTALIVGSIPFGLAAQTAYPTAPMNPIYPPPVEYPDTMDERKQSKKMKVEDYGEVRDSTEATDQVGNLLGVPLVDDADESYGSIDDFEFEDDRLVAVHVTIGATLGLGGTTYRVPFSELEISERDDELVARLSREAVEKLSRQNDEMKEFVFEDDGRDTSERWSDRADRMEREARDTAEEASDTVRGGADAMKREARELTGEAKNFLRDLRDELDGNEDVRMDELGNLDIRVRGKRVTLRGDVRTEKAKDAIVEAAEELGDYEIVDRIKVRNSFATAD